MAVSPLQINSSMAIPLRFQLLILLLLLILISLFISAATADGDQPAATPSFPPSIQQFHIYPPSVIANILSTHGFKQLSNANLSAATPLTIFAPSDDSLLACASCSLDLLVQELSLPGLYPLHVLQSLAFGTKVETLAPNRCLTITTTTTTTDDNAKVFVNGVEITRPDLFNNGLVVIHGLHGFVSHLSPLSCNVERMTSLSFPLIPRATSVSSPSHSVMPLMLKDTILRLQTIGYSVVSLALRFKYAELSEFKAMTMFALDDTSIFSGEGNVYLSNLRYHVVPNKRLSAADLVSLPLGTSLPTMDVGQNLLVTTPGGGGPFSPMKINYMKITTIDLLHNSKIVIHGISSPFPHMRHPQGFKTTERVAEIQRSKCNHFDWNHGICEVEDQVPPVSQLSVANIEGRDGFEI